MSLWRGEANRIPTKPLTIVCSALFLAALPLIQKIAPWAIAVFCGALFLRVFINWRDLRLPSLPAKLALLAIGVGGVALSYGGIAGVEAGLGVLLILLSLKLLETNTVRDFQVLVLLGWFLCLCGLFFSQDLTTWLFLGAIALLLASALVQFHRGTAPGSTLRSASFVGKMLLQALPIVALLFIFFPRSQGGFRFQFSRTLTGVTGMSDRMSPGSFASLVQDDTLAFRVQFPDGQIPSISQLYWRGGVFWRGRGLTWDRGPDLVAYYRQLQGPTIRQRIFLEPHGGRWIFALDRPANDIRGIAGLEPGGYLQSYNPVLSMLRYDVVSRLETSEKTLHPQQRQVALGVPARVAPKVQALADSWRAEARSEREIVDLALRYFRKEKFVYTLTPETYGEDALAEFLFERRRGFCEHYAGAFASLMRLAGLPSRVVVGYLGGTYNAMGGYISVRQFDAHAWAEVWIKETGWLRVDPTDVVAPERISSGLESFLESSAGGGTFGGGGSSTGAAGLRDLLREARLVWDNLKYQWDLRVLNYDEETQHSVLAIIGLETLRPSTLVIWIAISILLVCGLLGMWLRVPGRDRRDPLVREYERFCRVLARAGVPREPWEGPNAFAERAANTLPGAADAIRAGAERYSAARYGGARGGIEEIRLATRRLAALPRRR